MELVVTRSHLTASRIGLVTMIDLYLQLVRYKIMELCNY